MLSPSERGAVLDELGDRLEASGLNVFGGVDGDAFDRTQPCGRRARETQPACGRIFVAGCGGSAFWRRMHADRARPLDAARWQRAVAAWSRAVSADAMRWLRARGVRAAAVYPHAGRSLNFVQLAEMAGLGTVSPVSGWLLHPEFGPWVSFRFALLVEGEARPSGLTPLAPSDFQPCTGCDQRCVRACPAQVVVGAGVFAFDRCAAHRHAGGCATGCEMRRACPCGAEHRPDPGEEITRHAATLRALQRHYGLGWWQVAPRWVRQG